MSSFLTGIITIALMLSAGVSNNPTNLSSVAFMKTSAAISQKYDSQAGQTSDVQQRETIKIGSDGQQESTVKDDSDVQQEETTKGDNKQQNDDFYDNRTISCNNNGTGLCSEQCVDADGDGICDNYANRGGKGGCDNFVDADGDGICDHHHENALGGGICHNYVDADGDGICDNYGSAGYGNQECPTYGAGNQAGGYRHGSGHHSKGHGNRGNGHCW